MEENNVSTAGENNEITQNTEHANPQTGSLQKPVINPNKIVAFVLPESGIEVVMDFNKNTAKLLDEARLVCEDDKTGYAVTRYIISNISTFNGHQCTVRELENNLDAFDIIELETQYGKARKKPVSAQAKTSA